MLKITSSLKRIKYLRIIFSLFIHIIFLPIYILMYLGKGSEFILGFIISIYFKLEKFLVKKFKLNEVAKKQYSENPKKFKEFKKGGDF